MKMSTVAMSDEMLGRYVMLCPRLRLLRMGRSTRKPCTPMRQAVSRWECRLNA